jgi:hypothetical protein
VYIRRFDCGFVAPDRIACQARNLNQPQRKSRAARMRNHDYLTIVAIYGHHDGASAIPSISRSMAELPGSRGLLLSISRPDALPERIQWAPLLPLNYQQYSLFVMYCLHNFIDTEYALIVQDDGWVLNGECWCDGYLEYDYIGAPCHAAIVGDRIVFGYQWVHEPKPLIIQNGGLSLRSRRFMREPSIAGLMYQFSEVPQIQNEDVQLTGLFHQQLKQRGIRFAPTDVAKQFAVEYLGPVLHDDLKLDELFGVHGRSRRLVGENRIRFLLPQEQIHSIYREQELVSHLEVLGYAIEYLP